MNKLRLARMISILILGMVLVQGCSSIAKLPVVRELPFVSKTEDEAQLAERNLGVRMIAVLPVDIKAGSPDAARMVREKLLEELYFKGYSKVPFEMVDAALADVRTRDGGAPSNSVSPQVIGSMLGVDAVMYTTLLEGDASYRFVYAPVKIAAVFELKSAKTGISLWRQESSAADRGYGVTKNGLELGTTKIFEDVVHDAVKKAMEDLPAGPGIK